MKYLPALAALLSLLACVLWIASLSEPWYHAPNKDGTEQRMGLYSSCTSKEYSDHHGHNMMADAMGITAMQHDYELAQRRKHDDDDDDDDDDDEYEHQHERHHHSKHHKHGRYDDDGEDQQDGKHHGKGEGKGKEYPTLQPITIQPTLPPNMNAPATQAPMQPQPTGPGDLQAGSGGAGGGGFGPFGGGGGGGGGMPMPPTPGPTALPVDDVPAGPVATPVPTSKHGRVYHDRGHDQEHMPEHEQKHKHEHDEKIEEYDDMILNQVSAGTHIPQTSQGVTHEHYLKKKHGTKHEIERTNAFPYDETWVMAMRILLILAIIVSGIAALLQLLMAWTVGQALHKGSWTTSPTTAIITTTLITLAGIHGLIVLFLFLSKRKELPSDGHYDYGHTLNIIATALSFLSPILFWYTLDTHTKYESLLGEETLAGGRRKYASVE